MVKLALAAVLPPCGDRSAAEGAYEGTTRTPDLGLGGDGRDEGGNCATEADPARLADGVTFCLATTGGCALTLPAALAGFFGTDGFAASLGAGLAAG